MQQSKLYCTRTLNKIINIQNYNCRFALNPSEVGSKMEAVPIKETMLSEICPDIESAFCFPHKYRTINGECNNVKNPTWGITGAAYLRILEPTYQDGKNCSEPTSNTTLLLIRCCWDRSNLSQYLSSTEMS